MLFRSPTHIIIIPVLHKEESRAQVLDYCTKLKSDLQNINFAGRNIEVEIDSRDLRGGDKMWHWIKRGAPIILEVGPRDIAEDSVFLTRRDKLKEKSSQKRTHFLATVTNQLQEMQDNLLNRALAFREANTVKIDTKEDFYKFFENENSGFAYSHWNGSPEVEEQIKTDLKVTIRCIPFDGDKTPGKCVITGEPSTQRVYFAKSY